MVREMCLVSQPNPGAITTGTPDTPCTPSPFVLSPSDVVHCLCLSTPLTLSCIASTPVIIIIISHHIQGCLSLRPWSIPYSPLFPCRLSGSLLPHLPHTHSLRAWTSTLNPTRHLQSFSTQQHIIAISLLVSFLFATPDINHHAPLKP